MLAIDVAWPQAIDRYTSLEVPWTTVRRWQQAIVEKIRGFGALIVQQAPSPLIAVFGIPRTMEQMPQRAVQAALALRQLMAEDHATDGEGPSRDADGHPYGSCTGGCPRE